MMFIVMALGIAAFVCSIGWQSAREREHMLKERLKREQEFSETILKRDRELMNRHVKLCAFFKENFN